MTPVRYFHSLSIQNSGKNIITLSKQRGEKVDEQTETYTTKNESVFDVFYFNKIRFKKLIGSVKIERNKATGNTQDYIEWNVLS